MTADPKSTGFWLALAFLVSIFLVVVYDTYVVFYNGRLETVSSYLIDWSQKFLAIPLFVGLVLGHLFFPGQASK